MTTTVKWNAVSGQVHLGELELIGASGSDQPWVFATHEAALNTALTAIFSAEALLYGTGIKPLPSEPEVLALISGALPQGLALPQAKPGTQTVLGDGVDWLSGADTAWNTTPRTNRNVAAIYQYAIRGAVRDMVRRARPTSQTPTMTDAPKPGEAGAAPNVVAAVPVALVVLVGVLGVAAIAAAAWAHVGATSATAQPAAGIKVQEAAIAAQLAFDAQTAMAQIQAGQTPTVSKIAETYANREKGEATWLPVAAGVGAGGLIVAGVAHFMMNRRKTNPAKRRRRVAP
jgi:hypothetical protein